MSHRRSFNLFVMLAIVMFLLSEGVFGQGQRATSTMTSASLVAVVAWNAIAQRAAITVAKPTDAVRTRGQSQNGPGARTDYAADAAAARRRSNSVIERSGLFAGLSLLAAVSV
jgi:hypothetical protein